MTPSSREMMVVKMAQGWNRVRAAPLACDPTPSHATTLVTAPFSSPWVFAKVRGRRYAGGIFWNLAIALVASGSRGDTSRLILGVKLPPTIMCATTRPARGL